MGVTNLPITFYTLFVALGFLTVFTCIQAISFGNVESKKCSRPGYTYHPDSHTICTCHSFLVAKCQPLPDKRFPPQPLDPLTPYEITMTADIIKQSSQWNGEYHVFNTISLQEPPKADLVSFYYKGLNPPKTSYSRKSVAIFWSRRTGRVFEAVVNLDEGDIESLIALPVGTRVPIMTPEDYEEILEAVKVDDAVIEKCAGLGILDMDLVHPVVWPAGYLKTEREYKGLKRPLDVWMYTQNFEDDNAYAHPLPFVIVMEGMGSVPRVIAIEDLPTHEAYDMGKNKSGNKIPRREANYDPRLRPTDFLRRDDKPIKVTSPFGASYTIKGHEVQWQGFRFRLGFNPREGLTLHTITYKQSAESSIRPILYRASVSETGVFYGDPRPPFYRKYGFDEADIGLGWTNSLSAPDDCIGDVHFLNATVNDNNGNPVIIPNSICIFEDDTGILWRHTDSKSRKKVGVRSHRLNVMTIVTTGNYDLILTWSFYQDASIRFNIGLTGLISTNMMAVGATPGGFGSTVFPQVMGQFHQHFFALRLDADVGGIENSVVMHDVIPLEHPTGSQKNPYGNGFGMKETPLTTQEEGATDVNPSSGRVWVVTNPNVIHPYTKGPVGWKLIPSNDAALMLHPHSPILDPKLECLSHNVWVTQYKDDQIFGSGKFVEDSGLPEWIRKDPDASIENRDVVLWHVFTPVHIPRIEDFPTMPIEKRSMWFKPYNFFSENPGINVPPVKHHIDEL